MIGSAIGFDYMDRYTAPPETTVLVDVQAYASELIVAMGTPPQGAPSPWVQFIPFILILAIFYFIILLPMRRRQQKVQAFLSALKVGDRVVTSGGIYGSITKLGEQSVQLQVANNVRVEVSRAAIIGYQGQEPVAPEGSGRS
jgi:preprotein translocase subunit YajC